MSPDFLRYLADFTRKEEVTVGDLKGFVVYAEREFSHSTLFHLGRWKNGGLPQSLVELKGVVLSLPEDENQLVSLDIIKNILAINVRRLARLKNTSLRSSRGDTQTLFDALLPPIQNTARPPLPDEVWLSILRYLPPGAVLHFARVSIWANRLANDVLLWRQLYMKTTGKKYIPTAALPSVKPLLLQMLDSTWRALFTHPVLNSPSAPNTSHLTRLFPHGRQSLKTILSSPAPEGKGLMFLMQILSHQNKIKDYPEPAKTLFQSFLADATTNFSLHDERTQTTLALRYQRLLLILEYAFLKESGSLPESFLHTDASLSLQFSIPIDADDSNEPFWNTLDTQLEEINTKKLITSICKADLVTLTEDERSTLSAEQILRRANQNFLNSVPQYRFLDLPGFGFSRLPRAIKYLTALQELDFSDNQLTSLPPEIGDLTALRTLSLDNNMLTSLPREIGLLTALNDLCLYSNQLTSLPSEIFRLASLHKLSFGSNQLTSLPEQIGQLTALQALNIATNQLTSLPPEIGDLTALRELWLYNNQLTSLPREIGRLTALHKLLLYGNQLTSLPYEIVNLSDLEEIGFSYNTTLLVPVCLKGFLHSQTIRTTGKESIMWVRECSRHEIDQAFKKGIDLNPSATPDSFEMRMQKQLISSLSNEGITTKTLELLGRIAHGETYCPALTKQLLNELGQVLIENPNSRPVTLQILVKAIRVAEQNTRRLDAGTSSRPRA